MSFIPLPSILLEALTAFVLRLPQEDFCIVNILERLIQHLSSKAKFRQVTVHDKTFRFPKFKEQNNHLCGTVPGLSCLILRTLIQGGSASAHMLVLFLSTIKHIIFFIQKSTSVHEIRWLASKGNFSVPSEFFIASPLNYLPSLILLQVVFKSTSPTNY